MTTVKSMIIKQQIEEEIDTELEERDYIPAVICKQPPRFNLPKFSIPEVTAFIHLELKDAYKECARVCKLQEIDLMQRYSALSPAMQKMNLTNRVRAAYIRKGKMQ